MTLTGEQLREACEVLWWKPANLQQHAALPPSAIERALAAQGAIGGPISDEIVLKDAFHRAGIEFTPDGGVRLRTGEA